MIKSILHLLRLIGNKAFPFRSTQLLLLSFLISCTPQDLQNVLGGTGPLSNEEVVAGLREALRVGAQRGVDKASVTEGFWKDPRIKIPFPPEAIKVKNTLLQIGMTQQVEDFERTLNKAAETAAREAVPVFVDAITSLSIQDGFTILRGGDRAATDLLRDRTQDQLRTRFMPVVKDATSAVALTSYWQPLASAYNTSTIFTGQQAVDPDLDAYVTQKALDGLFLLLAEEEKKIREDPIARTTALLKRVFAQQ
ncbi:MAG: DUF4197 domain-containing protein [Bacteroidota bacterium]|nr:DUF4197 domain-containing protein [Bacteroidota bacterium]